MLRLPLLILCSLSIIVSLLAISSFF